MQGATEEGAREAKRILHMAEGSGEISYASNSVPQVSIITTSHLLLLFFQIQVKISETFCIIPKSERKNLHHLYYLLLMCKSHFVSEIMCSPGKAFDR